MSADVEYGLRCGNPEHRVYGIVIQTGKDRVALEQYAAESIATCLVLVRRDLSDWQPAVVGEQ